MYRKYAPLIIITLVALYIVGCGRLLDPFDPPRGGGGHHGGGHHGGGHGRDTCGRDTVIVPPDTTDPWPPDTTDPWPPDTTDPWPPDTVWVDPGDTLRHPHDTLPGRRR